MADNINDPALDISAPPAGLDEFIQSPSSVAPSAATSVPEKSSSVPQGLDEFIEPELKEAKYGTLGQQAKAFAEGALSAATFGLGTGIETALGVKPEDIQARREVSPVAHAAGQVAGLFAPTGVAGALTKGGIRAAEVLGLTGASTASKIGSAVVKGIAENAMFQAGDEVSRMFSQDPNQSAETAIADIGLAGLIGGAVTGGLGAINPLWKATVGNKVGGTLKAIQDKVGGVEGLIPDAIDSAAERAGITLDPVVRTTLASDPAIQSMAQKLADSATSSGAKAREALDLFKKDATDVIGQAFNKTPEQISALEHLDEFQAGADLKKSLIKQLKETTDPISNQFEKVAERFKTTELLAESKALIAEEIAKTATEKGYTLSASAPGTKIINTIIEELPALKTLEDLRKYQSIIGEKVADKQLWSLGKDLKAIFRRAEDSILDKTLGEKAPELVSSLADARSAYKTAMSQIEDLNSRLHVGRYSGPGSFVKALEDMAPEDVLRRLSPRGDAGIIGELSQRFPSAAEQLKDFHVSQILKIASQKAQLGEILNLKTLFTQIDKLSPQAKEFLLPGESSIKLDAIRELIETMPKRMNKFGASASLDAILSHLPESAAGLAAGIGGQSFKLGALGFILGNLTKGAPDAIRLSLLKFLGSNKPLKSEGFKAMVDYISAVSRGEALINKAAKNTLKVGVSVIPQSIMPTEADRNKIKKVIDNIDKNPDSLMNLGGETGHYIPEHGTAISQISTNVINYLNQNKPDIRKKNVLDGEPQLSAAEKAKYNTVLNIAQQPLIVLNKIQNGTITPKDIEALNSMYPSLYNQLIAKINDSMVNALEKGETIPYKTRLGLSMFLGQPLDSTMTPSGISNAQPTQGGKSSQEISNTAPQKQAGRSLKSLDKLPEGYRTQSQQRNLEKASK